MRRCCRRMRSYRLYGQAPPSSDGTVSALCPPHCRRPFDDTLDVWQCEKQTMTHASEDCDYEAYVLPNRWPQASYSCKIRLHRRLKHLDRASQFELKKVEGSDLFDFQQAASEWLRHRCTVMRSGGYSLLEMAAGCGKTRAVAHFLHTCQGNMENAPRWAVYITQSGLVRQTVLELSLYCQQLFKAETTRELLKAVTGHRGGVIVVNAAIRSAWLPLVAQAWCVILDEAHHASINFISRLARALGSHGLQRLVLVTATPTASRGLVTLAAHAASQQHFVLLKGEGEEMMQALRMPGVEIVEVPQPLPPGGANAVDVLNELSALPLSRLSIFLLSLSVAAWEKDSSLAPALWQYVADLWEHLHNAMSRQPQALLRLRMQHEAIEAHLALFFSQSDACSNQHIAALRRLLKLDAQPVARGRYREVCPCCGLQDEELLALRSVQQRCLFFLHPDSPHCPLPHEWAFGTQPFVRAILRFPTAAHVRAYQARAVRRGTPLACVWLSSDLCAAQRAVRVRRFASSQEHPEALALLSRSGFNGSPISRMVSYIGAGVLLKQILEHVADRQLLVCDARCGDVGYNLQCATHVLAPCLPRSAEDVQQLIGRANRIGRSSLRRVQLLCLPRQDTGERLFVHHLQHAVAPRM
jgi:hypothetical protein